MHSALYIEELVQNIISYLRPEDAESTYLGSQEYNLRSYTLNSLARTCTALHDAASDALWSTQRSLVPLVRCLGDAVVQQRIVRSRSYPVETLCLNRPLTDDDFERMLRRSRRIRAFRRDYARSHNLHQDIDPELLSALASSKYVFFPNLRSLEWPMEGIKDDCSAHIFSKFLSPSLRNVCLELCMKHGYPTDIILGSTFEISPGIEHLVLSFSPKFQYRGVYRIPDVLQQLTKVLMRSTGLKSLQFQDPFPNTNLQLLWPVLSTSPQLSKLALSIMFCTTTLSEPSTTALTFASLRHITLKTNDIPTVISLLDTTTFPILQSFTLKCLTPSSPSDHPGEQISELFGVFNRRCSHTQLQSIDITADACMDPHIGSSRMIHPEVLGLLTVFSNLQTLRIGAWWHLDQLDDTCLIELTNSWPRLRSISFDSKLQQPLGDTLITINGLFRVCRQCPELEMFDMHLNGEVLPGTEEEKGLLDLVGLGGDHHHHPLETLCIGKPTTQLVSPEQLAKMFVKYFPRLKQVDGAKKWVWSCGTQFWDAGWDEVNRYLKDSQSR
ncbi:hypothetical protein C8Q75DRAFT_730033 [Abortiporus biennis]|nr:hypothetical protein C8Q75DRAFT_730033 [Abortiporus biennis]